MVIDTSVLVAILLGEPEAEPFALAIAGDPERLISTFTALETAIVIEAKNQASISSGVPNLTSGIAWLGEGDS